MNSFDFNLTPLGEIKIKMVTFIDIVGLRRFLKIYQIYMKKVLNLLPVLLFVHQVDRCSQEYSAVSLGMSGSNGNLALFFFYDFI